MDRTHIEKCAECLASVSVCDKTHKPIVENQHFDTCIVCYHNWVRLTPELAYERCKRKGHDWVKVADDNTFDEIEEEWNCQVCDAVAHISGDVRTSDLRFIGWED